MAKQLYRAVRKSSFIPMHRGTEWVVIEPSGLIYDILSKESHEFNQNEAIALAKKLNESA